MLGAIRRRGAEGTAIAVLFIAAAVGLGWLFQVEALQSFVPGRVTMKVPTLLAFILFALAILILRHDGDTRIGRSVALALSLAIATFSVLVLVEYFLGIELPFERWIAGEPPGAVETVHPGRMAPNTAASFVLLVAALWLLRARSKWLDRIAAAMLHTVAISTFLVVLGYVYGIAELREVGSLTPMSLPSAICFLFIGTSIAMTRPEYGLSAIVLEDRFAGATARMLLPAAVLVPITIGWLRVEGQRLQLYGTEFGTAVVAIAHVLVFVSLIWVTVAILQRLDRQRLETEEKLRELTITDHLTGLYNRRGFTQLATAELHLAQRNQLHAVLLYIDVDAFKAINDKFGHREGDAALLVVAALLRNTFRDADVIGRTGGDEFSVFLVSANGDREVIIERLRSALRHENASRLRPYTISLSIGFAATAPEDGVDIDKLLRRADRDMFAAKGRIWIPTGDTDSWQGLLMPSAESPSSPADEIKIVETATRVSRQMDRVQLTRPLQGVLSEIGVVSVLDVSATGGRIWSSHEIDPNGAGVLHLSDARLGIDATFSYRVVWQRRDSRLGYDAGLEWEPDPSIETMLATLCARRRSNGTTDLRAADRFQMPTPLHATFSDAGDVSILDVSNQGLRIQNRTQLDPEKTGTMSIGSSTGPAVTAKVVWSRPTNSADANRTTIYETGVQVIGGASATEWLVAAVVASRRNDLTTVRV